MARIVTIPKMKYKELYETGKNRLICAGIAEAELDARLLLEYVCGTDRNALLVHGDREVQAEQEQIYLALIEKRASHIPLQHLTGVQEFMGLEFCVSGEVLIPRQDTELLVEEVLRDFHDGCSVLDMCTGSGCILISLLHYSNDCHGTGVDLSPGALKVAEQNAKRLLKDKTDDTRWEFIESDLFEKVQGKFDVIVSNPPYIRTEVIPELMEEVREHEPMLALDGKTDGLHFYRRIINESRKFLYSGGRLFLEIGYDQGDQVLKLMKQAGYKDVGLEKDYAGLDRVVYGRYEE